jgi:hypothetical protein
MKTIPLFLVLFAAGPATLGAFDCDGVAPVSGDAVTLELVTSDITYPVDVTAPPGDTERLFVAEQPGRIRIVNLADDRLVAQPFLDIESRDRVSFSGFGGERGFLGLAFHPDYVANGLFFVYYTRRPDGATVVARYSVMAADPNRADPDSEVILLTVPQPATNHNGGQVVFGPHDGYLYIGTGDGGSACDLSGGGNNSQNPDSLLGKLLRIDVDHRDPGLEYAVPPDNPFVGESGVRPEIWALGLRNPWRFTFDTGAPDGSRLGDIYIADVGQYVWEEVDYRPGTTRGGENYEWVVREGDHSSTDSGCTPSTLTVGTPVGPILEYRHGWGRLEGQSITGGPLYRGCRMPDLHGTYFFANYYYGDNPWMASFRVEDGNVTDLRDRTDELNAGISPATVREPSSFGVDARGEMYLCDHGAFSSGKLYRIVPASAGNRPPVARIVPDPDPPVVTLEGGSAAVVLDGSSSDDGDGGSQELTYTWAKVIGPAGYEIAAPDGESTRVAFTAAGEYIFRLTVSDGADSDSAEETVTVREPGDEFRRGDSNADGRVDLSDGVHSLLYLFAGGPAPTCRDAADADDNGALQMADAINIFTFLFLGAATPPAPGPAECGSDGTPDDELGCASFPPCAN